MSKEKYFVYHIPHPLHYYDLNYGYVGVTHNLKSRFINHKSSKYPVGCGIRKYKLEFEELQILFEFEDCEDAYSKELELRPISQIGWNICQGGNGFIHGSEKSVYSRAKMSESKKGKSNRQSNKHYKKISESQKGIPRTTSICPFCNKEIGEGNATRWHFGNCKNAPIQHTFINGFDIDGVICLPGGGVFPGPNDVIISGRSFEEKIETEEFLKNKNIRNKLYLNKLKFDEKSIESSGLHKANTIWNLFKMGITIQIFFEDDWDQMRIEQKMVKKLGLKTQIVWINHNGLVKLSNIRRDKEGNEI